MKLPLTLFFLSALAGMCLHAKPVGPWNEESLKKDVPIVTWVDRSHPVHALSYVGGEDQKVWAFYASPTTLGTAQPDTKYPGVVCIHGDGSGASAEWVYHWAKRGYAAISMDLNGARPALPKFDSKGALIVAPNASPKSIHFPEENDRHARYLLAGYDDTAASVMRAHCLLRSFPEVDGEQIAVIGIDFGSQTACLVASLDNRFKAVVAVYCCGFLRRGVPAEVTGRDKIGNLAIHMGVRNDLGDLLSAGSVPTLFIERTQDLHADLDLHMRRLQLEAKAKQIRIQTNMAHSDKGACAPQEIDLFIDSQCRGGTPLPLLGKLELKKDQILLNCSAAAGLQSGSLHFTTNSGKRSPRQWTTIPAKFSGNTLIAEAPPSAATIWYISITDRRGAMVSTPAVFRP